MGDLWTGKKGKGDLAFQLRMFGAAQEVSEEKKTTGGLTFML